MQGQLGENLRPLLQNLIEQLQLNRRLRLSSTPNRSDMN